MGKHDWNTLLTSATNMAEQTYGSDGEYGSMVLHYILEFLGSREQADSAYKLALNKKVVLTVTE
jgi:hypothetical protein